jgi:hypothetical protein
MSHMKYTDKTGYSVELEIYGNFDSNLPALWIGKSCIAATQGILVQSDHVRSLGLVGRILGGVALKYRSEGEVCI